MTYNQWIQCQDYFTQQDAYQYPGVPSLGINGSDVRPAMSPWRAPHAGALVHSRADTLADTDALAHSDAPWHTARITLNSQPSTLFSPCSQIDCLDTSVEPGIYKLKNMWSPRRHHQSEMYQGVLFVLGGEVSQE